MVEFLDRLAVMDKFFDYIEFLELKKVILSIISSKLVFFPNWIMYKIREDWLENL